MVPTDTGTVERKSVKTVEQLLESGIEIPDDPIAIARLLDDGATAPPADSAAKPAEAPTDAPNTEPPKPDAPKPDDDAAAQAAAAAAAAAAATTPEEDDAKGPPRALLRTYRQQLHDKDRRLEETEQEKAEALKKAEGDELADATDDVVVSSNASGIDFPEQ